MNITRALTAATLLVAFAGASACEMSDGRSPEVRSVEFLGQGPDAPLVVITRITFFDPNGDLGEGTLESFVNGRPSGLGILELTPYFLFAELPLDANEGSFDFQLELNLDDDGPESSSFDLGFRLIDALGNTSTTRAVRLRVDR